MFETDVYGIGIPCDHPIHFYHRVAAFVHHIFEKFFPLSHHLMSNWMCSAYERVYFQFPCAQCEEDRTREYGAVVKSDDDVIERLRRKNPFRQAEES